MAKRKTLGDFGPTAAPEDDAPTPYQPEMSFEAPTAEQLDQSDIGAFAWHFAQKSSLAQWSPTMLTQGSDIITSINVSEDQRAMMAAMVSDTFLADLYGSDVTAWLMASRITDPAQREAMMERLRQTAAGNVDIKTRQTQVSEFSPATRTEYLNPYSGEWQIDPVDVQAAYDPLQEAGVNELTHRNAAIAAFYATAVDEEVDGQIVQTFDYSETLTPNIIKQMDEAVTRGSTDRGFAGDVAALGPAGQNEFKGSIIRVEEGSNTYEMNEEWALAHPTKAFAVQAYIAEKHPGSTVRVGGQGMLHPAMEVIGRPIDFVSSPVAIAYKYLARGAGEIGEQAAANLGFIDRAESGRLADQLEDDINKGIVPQNEVDEMLSDISRLRDFEEAGNYLNEGESLSDDINNAFMPESAGLGLAQMSAEGIGLYESDPLYGPWVAATALIHNFSLADPLGWIGAIKKGSALAANTPLGGVSGVVRKAASAKEAAAFGTKGGGLSRYLADSQWVRVRVADDPTEAGQAARVTETKSQLEVAATRQGYDVVEVSRADGGRDFIIMGMDSEEGLNVAKRLGQDRIVTADGIIHADRTITPVDWGKNVGIYDEGADIVHLPGRADGMRLDVPDDSVRLKPAPPKVSQNWLVQKAFERWAKTPDEIMYTEQAVQTSNRIFDEVSAARKIGEAEASARGADGLAVRKAGATKALGVLGAWSPSYDSRVLQALADARSGDEVRMVLEASVLGGIRDPFYISRAMTRQATISTRLGKIGDELNQFRRLESELAARAESLGVTDMLAKNLDTWRDFTNGGQGGPLRKLVDDYQKAKANVTKLDRERIDLLGERYHLASVLELDEVTLPIRQLPPDKLLKVLTKTVKAAERSDVEDLLVALSQEANLNTTLSITETANLMTRLEDTLKARGLNARQAKRVMNQAERARAGKSRQVFRAWQKFNTKLTGGQQIHMPVPGQGIPEGQLADYQRRSLEVIRDRARLFGLQQADIDNILAAYIRVEDREGWYTFVKRFYEDIADKSPHLDARSRTEMRNAWADLFEERGGGYLVAKSVDNIADKEHTLSRIVTDPATGNKLESGVPMFSGDFLDIVHLPTNEMDLQHLSTVRRWTTRHYQSGEGAADYAAQALMGARDVINASTYMWKAAVLMGRMPFALLSRIQGEQAWRMAALDYASSVNHPMEWIKSVLKGGDYARFSDSHAQFLGVLVDNYNEAHSFGRSVRVFRRGRQALTPMDGDRYWNAVSSMFARRFRSAEVSHYLTEDPDTIVAWLRGPNSGATGDGVIDNIMSTRTADQSEDLLAMSDEEYLKHFITRAQRELDDLVGGNGELKAALLRGRTPKQYDLPEGDEAYFTQTEGTYQLGDEQRTWVQIDGADGEYMRLAKDGDSYYVDYVEVPEDIRGQRAGLRLYAQAQAYAQTKGSRLTSGVTVSDDAKRVWRSLVREGRAMEIPITAQMGTGQWRYIADELREFGEAVPGTGGVEVGTNEFGSLLKRMYDEGDYVPAQFMNGKAAEYVRGDQVGLAGRFRDWAFQQFYARPDVYLSRAPLMRQVAAREYDRLRALGWNEARATDAATAHATRFTSDWMYDLAARTSGQYFLRNIMPFFPAFQELGGVWLKRLPMQAGGGGAAGWAAGSAYYAHRADVLQGFFQDLGLIDKNAQGEWQFGIPGLDAIYSWLTGEDQAKIRFNAESITGMLPTPKWGPEGLDVKSLIPGLGPMPSVVLGKLAQHNEVIANLTDTILPYGDYAKLGPTSINHLFHAVGQVPPWEYLTKDVEELMINFSIEDAMRSVSAEMRPFPKNGTAAEKKAWSEELIHRSEQRSSAHYLTRALASMISPASIDITNEYEEEMGRIWKFVENYREGSGRDASVASPLIEGFKKKYPNAVWYSNSKTISHMDRNTEDFDEFLQAWNDGEIRAFTPKEFVSWNLGMTNYWNTVGKNAQFTDGMTGPDILVEGFGRKQVTSDTWAQWDMYLQQHPEFNGMFQEWQRSMDDQDTVQMPQMQQRLLDLKRDLQSMSDNFSTNGIRDVNYQQLIGRISEQIDYVARKSDDPAWRAVGWWYENVGDAANEGIGALYDKAFSLPGPQRGPIFEEIRQLKNSWEAVEHNGQTFPTPEEVWWGNKSPEEQTIKLQEWASSPLEWLSDFELEKAGYGSDPRWGEMAGILNRDANTIKEVAAENYWSPGSLEYEALERQALQSQVKWAQENDMLDELALTLAAPYQRVLYTGAYGGNATFAAISEEVTYYTQAFKDKGISIAGSTREGRQAQEYFFEKIEAARAKDQKFDALMTNYEQIMGDDGRPAIGYEMYFKLFFDYFGPTPYVNV